MYLIFSRILQSIDLHKYLTSFMFTLDQKILMPQLFYYAGNTVVTIGDVSKEVKPGSNPEYVPRKYCKFFFIKIRF